MKPLSEAENLIRQIDNEDSKLALTFPHTEVLYRNQQNQSKIMFFCPEAFITIPSVIYGTKNFYLMDALSTKIEDFKASGLIEFWNREVFPKGKKLTEYSQTKQKITFENLSGCFQFCVLYSILAVLVFLGEIVFNKLSTKK